jgi:hypothetical protein
MAGTAAHGRRQLVHLLKLAAGRYGVPGAVAKWRMSLDHGVREHHQPARSTRLLLGLRSFLAVQLAAAVTDGPQPRGFSIRVLVRAEFHRSAWWETPGWEKAQAREGKAREGGLCPSDRCGMKCLYDKSLDP